MKSCVRNTSILIVGDYPDVKKRVVKYVRCKQWDCEYCAEINTRSHRARIIQGYNTIASEGGSFAFVTLTCSQYARGREKSVKNWRENWHKLRKRLARVAKKNGEKIHYVYIPEFHKDGSLHVHGLFRDYVNQRWWKNNAHNCKLGYMVKAEKIENAGMAVWYCTKYMSKHLTSGDWIKYFRRINYSKSFPKLPEKKIDGDWQLVSNDTPLIALALEGWRKGFEVEFFGERITTDIFLDRE